MTVKERTEKQEREYLCSDATLSADSRGRKRQEEPCVLRTDFQRDRDRIIHCKSFRRLKHKTQVFLAPQGDHYRTRLTHTLEVSQIARTVSRALMLNEDLTEAIALGHDLGHTPFGHAGERALGEVSENGFLHNEQSVRIVERLEKNGAGLNLTYEVIDGILNHKKSAVPLTPEGRVVQIADRIAYLNHDIDDALRAKVINENDIPQSITSVLGTSTSGRIDALVSALVSGSSGRSLKMDSDSQTAFDELYAFMKDAVYSSEKTRLVEANIPEFIKRLYTYFYNLPEKLPAELKPVVLLEGRDRAVCDFIASMSDLYAIRVYEDIFVPKTWGR